MISDYFITDKKNCNTITQGESGEEESYTPNFIIVINKRNSHLTITQISAKVNKSQTDESKFEILGSKRRIFVRGSLEKTMMSNCVVPTHSCRYWLQSSQQGNFAHD